MRTKAKKNLQHTRLDANSFVSVKLWKQTKNHQYFWGSNKKFTNEGVFFINWGQPAAQECFYALLQLTLLVGRLRCRAVHWDQSYHSAHRRDICSNQLKQWQTLTQTGR